MLKCRGESNLILGDTSYRCTFYHISFSLELHCVKSLAGLAQELKSKGKIIPEGELQSKLAATLEGYKVFMLLQKALKYYRLMPMSFV